MASGSIKNTRLRVTNYTFTNLAQYNPQGYYLGIPNIRSKAGIPTNAIIVSATLYGWGYLGSGQVAVAMNGEDGLYIEYLPGYTISSSSYVNIRFVYQI